MVQPLPVRFIRIKQVSKLVGLSESTIRRYEAKGDFPSSVKLSKRTTVWLEKDVVDWLNNLGRV